LLINDTKRDLREGEIQDEVGGGGGAKLPSKSLDVDENRLR